MEGVRLGSAEIEGVRLGVRLGSAEICIEEIEEEGRDNDGLAST